MPKASVALTYHLRGIALHTRLTCVTEFKEIRKEWKAKKKEEETARKQEEERQRQEAQRHGQDTSQAQGQPAQYGQQHMMHPQMGGPQLPPIGYPTAGGQPAGQYAQPQQVDGAPQYSSNGQLYTAQGYPQSPYAQGGMQYQQRKSTLPIIASLAC